MSISKDHPLTEFEKEIILRILPTALTIVNDAASNGATFKQVFQTAGDYSVLLARHVIRKRIQLDKED